MQLSLVIFANHQGCVDSPIDLDSHFGCFIAINELPNNRQRWLPNTQPLQTRRCSTAKPSPTNSPLPSPTHRPESTRRPHNFPNPTNGRTHRTTPTTNTLPIELWTRVFEHVDNTKDYARPPVLAVNKSSLAVYGDGTTAAQTLSRVRETHLGTVHGLPPHIDPISRAGSAQAEHVSAHARRQQSAVACPCGALPKPRAR